MQIISLLCIVSCPTLEACVVDTICLTRAGWPTIHMLPTVGLLYDAESDRTQQLRTALPQQINALQSFLHDPQSCYLVSSAHHSLCTETDNADITKALQHIYQGLVHFPGRTVSFADALAHQLATSMQPWQNLSSTPVLDVFLNRTIIQRAMAGDIDFARASFAVRVESILHELRRLQILLSGTHLIPNEPPLRRLHLNARRAVFDMLDRARTVGSSLEHLTPSEFYALTHNRDEQLLPAFYAPAIMFSKYTLPNAQIAQHIGTLQAAMQHDGMQRRLVIVHDQSFCNDLIPHLCAAGYQETRVRGNVSNTLPAPLSVPLLLAALNGNPRLAENPKP